jgi:hypothetical protein
MDGLKEYGALKPIYWWMVITIAIGDIVTRSMEL